MSLRERLLGPSGDDTPPLLGQHRLLAHVYQPRLFDGLDVVKAWCWDVSNERGPLNWVGDRLDDVVTTTNNARAAIAWRLDRGHHG